MAVDAKMLADIERADVVERKAITQVMNLSKTKIDEVLWVDDSNAPEERRKRDFRVVIGGVVIPFEVKADFKSKETGNIALEYECHGKPSGLAATCSVVWAHMVPFHSGWRMYFARVVELRKNLMTEIVPGFWRPSGPVAGFNYERLASNAKSGDSNPSMNMLLKIEGHVTERSWWMDAEAQKPCSVDWRILGRSSLVGKAAAS